MDGAPARRAVDMGLRGTAVAFSLLVGVSRVYLDEHWASDVGGGWAIGLAVSAACIALSEWMVSRAAARDAAATRQERP